MQENLSSLPPLPFFDNALDKNISTDTEVIAALRNLKKHNFVDDYHYEYYRRYIQPKMKNGRISFLGISETGTYILVKTTIRRKQKTWDGYCFVDYDYLYLFINSHGKFYVNKLHDFLGSAKDNINGINILSDEDIYYTLGFRYNITEGEESRIEIPGIYLVQGEIMIHAYKPEDYQQYIINRFSDEIDRFINMYRAWKVSQTLHSLRISNTVESETNIMIHEILPISLRRNSKREYKILESLGKVLLRKYIAIEKELIYNDYYVSIKVRDETGEYLIEIHGWKNGVWSSRGDDVGIVLKAISNNIDEIVEDLKNEIKELPRITYNRIIGNHNINITNCIPLRLSYIPKLFNVYNISIHYNDNEDGIVVFPDSELVISHDEHGEKRIRFNEIFIISFRETNVDPNFSREFSRAALYSLLKR